MHDVESIQKTARNFMGSRVLLSGVELDLFTLLRAEAMNAQQVGQRLKAGLRGVTMLLDALAALGYLTKEDGLYKTEPSVATLLSADSPDSILPSLRHAANLWKSWSRLTEIVAPEGPAELGKESAFIGAMQVRAQRDAARLVEVVDPGKAQSLLDIGGASGVYITSFLQASPHMTATLFDLPHVIEMARGYLSKKGFLNRVRLVAGDFVKDDLPGVHDLALLSAIIHMNSREQNVRLYRKVHNALSPGGRIVIRDFIMEPDRTRPAAGALFAINMLVNTEGGGTYTFKEIREDLEKAGFMDIVPIDNDDSFSLVEGYKALS